MGEEHLTEEEKSDIDDGGLITPLMPQ